MIKERANEKRSLHLEEENTMRTLTLKVKTGCIIVIITNISINSHLGVTISIEKTTVPMNLK